MDLIIFATLLNKTSVLNKIIFRIALIALIGLSGCSDFVIPDEVNQFAKTFLKDVKKNGLYTYLNESEKKQDSAFKNPQLDQLEKNLQKINPDSLVIINGQATKHFRGDQPDLVYQIEYEQNFDDHSILILLSVIQQNGNYELGRINSWRIDNSLKEQHAFVFENKPIINYLFLVLMIMNLLFIIYTVYALIKTQIKRKWLWIIGVLIGFSRLKLHWTSGEINFDFMSFQILGIGFIKSGQYSSWILMVSIPVVAIAFWIQQYKIKQELKNKEQMEKILSKYKSGND